MSSKIGSKKIQIKAWGAKFLGLLLTGFVKSNGPTHTVLQKLKKIIKHRCRECGELTPVSSSIYCVDCQKVEQEIRELKIERSRILKGWHDDLDSRPSIW